MKTWQYQDQGGKHVITDDEILTDYFPYWAVQMHRAGRGTLINTERCIDDFVAVHQAWDITK